MFGLRNIARPAARAIQQPWIGRAAFHAGQPRWTGKTIEANAQNFDELVTKADHPILVDFYADWCGPCKMLGPVLSKLVEANPKVTLVKIDVDKANDIAQKYKISALPTVAAFHNGEVVEQFVGMLKPPQVEAFVKKHAEKA
ncbi:thioredoxin-like protein [Syncephalastrum racemosum]|uniref:Thioredoxin-like protein n=1 Tax=Syncephalastrum racemosum TaxID=13706 RepID=A0A1X2H9R0_SYNRA|nr:thioredoxin-like protein [Syncephalastrum racemosum]